MADSVQIARRIVGLKSILIANGVSDAGTLQFTQALVVASPNDRQLILETFMKELGPYRPAPTKFRDSKGNYR
jgi:hypothetical protein